MTTGATDTFTQQCDEIIADALTNVGALGPGKTPTGNQRTHAFRALNRLVKQIDASGKFLWREVRRDISVIAGTASYVMATDVLELESPANFRLTGQTARSPVYGQTIDDYKKIADRASTGTPLQYVVERTLTAFTVTLWPVPVAAGTLEVTCILRGKDFVIGSDTPDATTKWLQCLVTGLSWFLAPAYGQDGSTFRDEYVAMKDELLNDDNEKLGVQFVPWGNA